MTVEAKTKKCKKCGEIKVLSEFHKQDGGKNGVRGRCKVCLLAVGKETVEKYKESRTKYQHAHKEEKSAKQKIYDQDHKEEKSARNKIYEQTQKGKEIREKANRKRRALKMNVEYENFKSIEIFERDGYKCQHCKKKTRPDYKNPNHQLYPNLDHIIPLSKGGGHTKRNTQCLCHRCNLVKSVNDIGEQLRLFG